MPNILRSFQELPFNTINNIPPNLFVTFFCHSLYFSFVELLFHNTYIFLSWTNGVALLFLLLLFSFFFFSFFFFIFSLFFRCLQRNFSKLHASSHIWHSSPHHPRIINMLMEWESGVLHEKYLKVRLKMWLTKKGYHQAQIGSTRDKKYKKECLKVLNDPKMA